MSGSHTPTPARHHDDDDRLQLVSTAERGLPAQLADAIDGHLATFAAHVREGLLAASTAVGLEVMAEMMQAEVTELAGPKGRHTRTAPTPVTAPSTGRSPWVAAGCR